MTTSPRAPAPLFRVLVVLALAVATVHCVLTVYFATSVVEVPRNHEVAGPRLSRRVLLICIDGLRHDTALTTGWMPELIALSRRGAAGVALTCPVTMTGIGVRSIG